MPIRKDLLKTLGGFIFLLLALYCAFRVDPSAGYFLSALMCIVGAIACFTKPGGKFGADS